MILNTVCYAVLYELLHVGNVPSTILAWLAVDLLSGNSVFWKLISNVIITVLNYIVSKFWIFQKK